MNARRIQASVVRLLLLPLLLVLSRSVFAVSLGDELILSALGDPVEVEIEVLQWEDMDLDRVQISAASREEYDVFDLTWLPVLENLNFNLVGPDLNGKVRVLVSSRDPLDEPFLELLLVLRWPGGSLRREYVLLFDPPGAPASALTVVENTGPDANDRTTPDLPLIEDPAPPMAPAPVEVAVTAAPIEEPPALSVVAEPAAAEPEPVAAEPEPARRQSQPPAVVSVAEARAPAEAAARPSQPPVPEKTDVPDARTTVAVDVETVAPQPTQEPTVDTGRRAYQVHSGESLWNIARQFRPAGVGENIYQVLLSIHNLNRNSFINGNISLLKANAVLQVPTTADIERVDAATAQADFERRWDQGTQRFEAAQRGEAIPLFVDEEPAEVTVPVEDDLPPGTEAPPVDDEADALIMVSETNVPQPLQIAAGTETEAPSAAAIGTAGSSLAISNSTEAAVPATTTPPTVSTAVEVTSDAPVSTDSAAQDPIATTRASITAELETEVAAMRARRQSAEAVAQQLQASLEKARAERAAEASLFGTENLLLAGSALVLFGVLMAGIVATLRLAGDVRSLRAGTGGALYPQTDAEWLAGRASARSYPVERKEPRMPEIEVVELPVEQVDKKPSAAPASTTGEKHSDDLFARMEDIIGADRGNSPKNS